MELWPSRDMQLDLLEPTANPKQLEDETKATPAIVIWQVLMCYRATIAMQREALLERVLGNRKEARWVTVQEYRPSRVARRQVCETCRKEGPDAPGIWCFPWGASMWKQKRTYEGGVTASSYSK